MSPQQPRFVSGLACTFVLALYGCELVAGEPDGGAADAGALPGPDAQADAAPPTRDADTAPARDADLGPGGDAQSPDAPDAGDDRDGAAADAGDAAPPPGTYRAPCTASANKVSCQRNVTDVTFPGGSRKVYWAAPIGDAPRAGFPLAFIFQGSLFSPADTWDDLTPDTPFGGFYQGMLRVKLMEAGFVVVEPEAEGGLVWQTNGLYVYDVSTDRALMLALFERFSATEDFGAIDSARLYATGISSGGYMTSRMAVSHPGRFRALAIQSGSYATCTGPLCNVPATLPTDHPPTLFLHGDADLTVGLDTAQIYYEALKKQGIEAEMIIDEGVGHAWLPEAPEAVTAWFLAH